MIATGLKNKEVHIDILSIYLGLIKARSFSAFSKEHKTARPQELITSVASVPTSSDTPRQPRKRPVDDGDNNSTMKRQRSDNSTVC